MLAHIVRRIVATIPVMAIVALFVFSLLYIAPGDPAVVIAGDQASPEDIEKIRKGLGLDRPFLVRFGEWSWNILQADLGTSMFTGLPVTKLIAQRLEPTLSLMVVTLDPRRHHRRADGRHRRLEGRDVDRPLADGVRGVRLLRAGVRGRLPAGLCVRAPARLVSRAGLHADIARFLALAREPGAAGRRARLRLHRAHRPHHARLHARGPAAGLHPHGAVQGHGAGRHPVRARAQERGGAHRHRHRHRRRAADRRRRGDGKRVCDPGPRPPDHRCDPAPRLSA